MTKVCTKCGIEKPLSEYHNMKAHSDGHFPICKVCIHDMAKRYNNENRLRNTEVYIAQYDLEHPTKECAKCHITKVIKEFSIRRSDKDGHNSYCHDCASQNKRVKHESHKSLPQVEYKNWRTEQNAIRKAEKIRLKTEVFAHYCPDGIIKCVNPFGVHKEEMTDLDILSLDHINGDGHLDKDINGHRLGGVMFYRRLKISGYPNGLQVLCGSCQMKKKVVNHEHGGRKW
jgi:hypothetical protein